MPTIFATSSATALASRWMSITSGGIRTWPRRSPRAGKRILTYHVCDWLVPTRDLLLDRGMPGDGVIDLRSIRAMVEATGYNGPIDVEIFSAQNWWKREPSEVLRICLERHQTVGVTLPRRDSGARRTGAGPVPGIQRVYVQSTGVWIPGQGPRRDVQNDGRS